MVDEYVLSEILYFEILRAGGANLVEVNFHALDGGSEILVNQVMTK